MSRLLPGQPLRNPYTFILPLVVVGIPVFLLALVALWAIPITLFAVVMSAGPAPWSTVLAVLSLLGYFAAVAVAWRVGRRAPVAVGAATEWLSR